MIRKRSDGIDDQDTAISTLWERAATLCVPEECAQATRPENARRIQNSNLGILAGKRLATVCATLRAVGAFTSSPARLRHTHMAQQQPFATPMAGATAARTPLSTIGNRSQSVGA